MNNISKLAAFFLGASLCLIAAQAQAKISSMIYIVSVDYDNGSFSENSVSLVKGYAPDYAGQPISDYTAKLVSKSGKTLFRFKFSAPILCRDYRDPETGLMAGQCLPKDQATLTLVMPYKKQASAIKIYDSGNKRVLTIDVSDLKR